MKFEEKGHQFFFFFFFFGGGGGGDVNFIGQNFITNDLYLSQKCIVLSTAFTEMNTMGKK